MRDYKNLTNSELLSIIDSAEVDNKEFKEISNLAKTDMEFRARILEIKFGNKQDLKNLTEVLENAIDEASKDAKPDIQEIIDRIKKIIGNDNR
jgi:DNA-directed RNA polymerase subunit F